MAKGVRFIIKENIPQPLEDVLRKHRVLTNYVEYAYQVITKRANNLLKTRRMNTLEYQRKVREMARHSNNIVDAFLWEETKEGYGFWSNIYNEYLDRLEQLK